MRSLGYGAIDAAWHVELEIEVDRLALESLCLARPGQEDDLSSVVLDGGEEPKSVVQSRRVAAVIEVLVPVHPAEVHPALEIHDVDHAVGPFGLLRPRGVAKTLLAQCESKRWEQQEQNE